MVKIKIQLGFNDNADKHVWHYPEQESNRYSHLLVFIATKFPSIPNSYQIQYKDEEGDVITCASDSDLKDAFEFARESQLKSLKLFIVTKDHNAITTTTTTTTNTSSASINPTNSIPNSISNPQNSNNNTNVNASIASIASHASHASSATGAASAMASTATDSNSSPATAAQSRASQLITPTNTTTTTTTASIHSQQQQQQQQLADDAQADADDLLASFQAKMQAFSTAETTLESTTDMAAAILSNNNNAAGNPLSKMMRDVQNAFIGGVRDNANEIDLSISAPDVTVLPTFISPMQDSQELMEADAAQLLLLNGNGASGAPSVVRADDSHVNTTATANVNVSVDTQIPNHMQMQMQLQQSQTEVKNSEPGDFYIPEMDPPKEVEPEAEDNEDEDADELQRQQLQFQDIEQMEPSSGTLMNTNVDNNGMHCIFHPNVCCFFCEVTHFAARYLCARRRACVYCICFVFFDIFLF